MKVIHEVYWLRALACLAVVMVHAVNTTLEHYEFIIPKSEENILIAARFLVLFGTPAFIFISELLLAYAYPDQVPKGFFIKRVKFLLMPFAFMAFVFAVMTSESIGEFPSELALNLFLGGYTGYFILIIFQFYILHVCLHRYLKKVSPVLVLSAALMINTIYLGFFHVTSPPGIVLGEYIWERGHWLPFTGWVFYFALGYYAGRYYHQIMSRIVKLRYLLAGAAAVLLLFVFSLVVTDILDVVSSKRVDYILYTTAVVFAILAFTYRLKKVPLPVLVLSKYSFNVYLLHTVILHYLPKFEGLHPFLYFGLAVILSAGGSMLFAKFVSRFNITSYLIGKQIPVPNETRK
ncbi:membrane-bound acyltransferase YfiQ involved in biofilm formation [Salsuginibacillus halophilus]|uniref:Membrane-bound acyltransferase YfiQ involved in biofilm formation n=1 Tax=Salsuginibacillus halophilus TaxID=517424 RepID=A0A2P8H8L0_9BACI|nr:acyltransferase family protein [Salsuginibacillus halophilus]PSL42567.1 membrane-bound acyltransferase YfiQ involved in biofilm formation [Salsuginibacillus halophilus]